MKNIIVRAARIIREGGVVGFPTETVYGLGANALDAEAVARIFALKGRPSTSPLIVHVANVAMAREQVVAEWTEQAERLAEAYWPGPLTLVLPKQKRIPDIVTAGLPTVGVRVPAHPVALQLIRAAGVPIAAPSANRFTELSPTTAAHVRAAFGPDLLVLDGGPTDVGIESTVVSLVDDELVLLRPGMVTLDNIRQISTSVKEEEAHLAPGMHLRHYSPKTPLVLVEGGQLPPEGKGAYLKRTAAAEAAKVVLMPRGPDGYAAVLYSILHEVDAEGWDWIAVERPPATSEWAAIRDRLERAARR